MLLKNGNIFKIKGDEIFLVRSHLRLDSGLIGEISPDLRPESGEEVIDLKGDYVLPATINSHYHSYTNILRGASYGEPLEIWGHDTVALGASLDEEDMALSTGLGVCEMIRAGVASCLDHLPHLKTAEAAGKVYESSGLNVALAPMIHNIRDEDLLYGYPSREKSELKANFLSPEDYKDYYRDFISKFHRPESTSLVMVGINSPQRTDIELLEASSALASQYNLQIHSHLLESKWQKISRDRSLSPLILMDELGLLSEKTSLAHCLWLDEIELHLIQNRASTVVSNPSSNAFLGNKIFPLEDFRSRKIPIALGSDGVNCGTTNNMIEILRFFLLIERYGGKDYEDWLTMGEAFDMISKNAGKIFNFSRPLGQLEVGYGADLMIIDRKSLIHNLDSSLMNQIIFHSPPGLVKDLLVNGDFVMKDRVILSLDEEELRERLEERLPYLRRKFERALEASKPSKEKTKNIYKEIIRR